MATKKKAAKSTAKAAGTKAPKKKAATKSAKPKAAALSAEAPAAKKKAAAKSAKPKAAALNAEAPAPKKKAAAKSKKVNGLPSLEERDLAARALALAVAEAGLEHKALNVEIIDVRGKVDYCDYVLVMSGTSDRHVSALARRIEETVREKTNQRCAAVEGMPHGTWLLMDYSDVIVHIFHEDTRGYYDLENLWIDAARVSTPE